MNQEQHSITLMNTTHCLQHTISINVAEDGNELIICYTLIVVSLYVGDYQMALSGII